MRELPAEAMRCVLCDGLLIKCRTNFKVKSDNKGDVVVSLEFQGVPARRCDGCGQEYFEEGQVAEFDKALECWNVGLADGHASAKEGDLRDWFDK